jgi:type II secretory pathway predicted ATPase ExeA
LKDGRHPFDNTPEPQLFYVNAATAAVHDDLLSNVLAHKGLMLLVGAPGTGKTTLLLNLKETLETANCLVVLPRCATTSFDDLLEDCCGQLDIAKNAGNRVERVQTLARFLLQRLESGATTVFLIDDAQLLTIGALEDLSWLTDLEKGGQRLVQIVLAGQSDLVPRLCGSKLIFVQDSAIDYCELKPLGSGETGPYVQHRLQAAGYQGPDLFPSEAIERIAQYAAGVPRLINQLCATTLHLAVRGAADAISAEMVEAAVQELSSRTRPEAPANDGDERRSADAALDGQSTTGAEGAEGAEPGHHPTAGETAEAAVRAAPEIQLDMPAPPSQDLGQAATADTTAEDARTYSNSSRSYDDPESEFIPAPFPRNLVVPADDARPARWRGGSAPIAALFLVGLVLGGSGMFLYMAWPWSSTGIAPTETPGPSAGNTQPETAAPHAASTVVAPPESHLRVETTAVRQDYAKVPEAASRAASAPILHLEQAVGSEDEAVALDIRASLADNDGTAALAIAISGLPQGARLSAGRNNGDGIWSLSPEELDGLALMPPADFSGRLRLRVDASARWTDGQSAGASDFLLVEVVGTADPPRLEVADAKGREDQAVPLDIRAAPGDADDSEHLSVTIAGLPEGARLSAGQDNGDGSWRLRPSELAGLTLSPPGGFAGRFDLAVDATAREANGDRADATMSLTVNVAPAPAAVAAAKGDFVVQLAALRSAEDASRELSRLQGRYSQLLGDARLKIYEAEVNGVPYFRVRTEPVPDKAEVFQICARLKSNQQDCMVLQQIAKAKPIAAQADAAPAGTAPISLRPPETTLALAAASRPKLAAEPQTDGIAVRDLVTARDVIAREPAELTTTFSPRDGRAFAHARIYNPGGPTAVSFVWLYDDALYATVDMPVGTSVRWRTWSSAEVWLGEWRVQIVSNDGQVLAENAFTVQ